MTKDNNAQTILEIKGLGKWFGDFCALWDINLTVRPGERVVICGPSGSGKSTLIRCINQLESHQVGSVIINGAEVNGDMKNIEIIRREVGMVFQHFNLFPHLTILQNLTLGPIRNLKVSREEAETTAVEYLNRVLYQIYNRADSRFMRFSNHANNRANG